MLKKILQIIEEHCQAPTIHPSKRHLGIILTLVGFLLYAFYTIFFQIETFREKNVNIFYAGFLEFIVFNIFMFLSFLPFCAAKGKTFFKCKSLSMVIIRGIFANLCIWFYSLARVWTVDVDNSMLYSTDSFWIIIIMVILGMRVSFLTWIGMFIGIGGILFIYFIDLSSSHDLLGGVFGSFSGLFLAIIILLTRYMVRRDPPLRIGLYHSLIGIIMFVIPTIIIGNIYGWFIPRSDALIMMAISGFLFALTLFCFLEAFYYTESYIIGAVAFFLPVFIETINWVLTLNPVPLTTLVGSAIMTSGGVIIIISSYLKEKKEKTNKLKEEQIFIPETLEDKKNINNRK